MPATYVLKYIPSSQEELHKTLHRSKVHYASCALRSIENRKPNPTSPSRNYLREQNARRVCQGKRRDFRRLISVVRANRSLDSVQAYYILESSFSTPSFSLEFVITTREPRNRNLTQDIYIYSKESRRKGTLYPFDETEKDGLNQIYRLPAHTPARNASSDV